MPYICLNQYKINAYNEQILLVVEIYKKNLLIIY